MPILQTPPTSGSRNGSPPNTTSAGWATDGATGPHFLDCQFESICETCAYYTTDTTCGPVLHAQRDHAAKRDQHHRADLFQMLIERNKQVAP